MRRRPGVILYWDAPLRPRAKQSAVNTESYARSNHSRSGVRELSPWLESGLTSRLLPVSPFAGPRSDPSFLFKSPCHPIKGKKNVLREGKKKDPRKRAADVWDDDDNL